MGQTVSKAELSKLLGKDEKTIFRWAKEGMPVKKQGSRGTPSEFDMEAVVDWLITRATNGKEMEAAKLRLTIAQAENMELDVEEKRGALISVDTMKDLWGNVLSAFRARILSLPSRLTPQLASIRDAKKIDKLLKDTLHEALNELAEHDPTHNTHAKIRRKGSTKNSGGTAAS